MASCLRKTRTVLSVTKALVCRGMFVLHGLICIWRVTVIKSSVLYWALAGSLPLVVMETVYTICKKKNGEWKWVCPSVLLYLATTVPAIWFLELDVMTHRGLVTTPPDQTVSDAANASEEIRLGKIQLDISMGSEQWCKVLEQMLLLILIMGRWLLPKGDITREQLSQLLLVYIGMAADIIELFEAFKEDKVRENKLLNLTILSLWTASLTQFTLVLTATKSKRRRTSCVVSDEGGGAASCSNGVRGCCPTEVLSILLSVFLQDAPFLVLRMLLIFRYNVLSYSNIFFTSKNSLVLMLQIYRLIVLFTDSPDPGGAAKARPRDRHIVVTSGSSRSNSLSFSSNSDDSFSDGSDFDPGNSSDGSDWTRLRKVTDQRGHRTRQDTRDNTKGGSGSSFDTDPDSIPGTSLSDRKTVLVMTSSKQDSSGRGKGKLPKKAKGGMWVCRYQHRTSRKDKRLKGDRNADVKKSLRHPGSDYPSPVLPPPPESLNPNEGIDVAENSSSNPVNNNNSSSSNNNYISKTMSRNNSKSPKASPSRCHSVSSKDSKHLHDSPEKYRRHHGNDRPVIPAKMPSHSRDRDRDRDHDHDRKLEDSRSRRHNWSSIKGLQSVLAVLEEKGKYHTVVLKHAVDGTPVYVIDHEKHNGHNITV